MGLNQRGWAYLLGGRVNAVLLYNKPIGGAMGEELDWLHVNPALKALTPDEMEARKPGWKEANPDAIAAYAWDECDRCHRPLAPGMWPWCKGDPKDHDGKPAYGWKMG